MNQEKEILKACIKGDEKAQLQLFRTYGTLALRVAWRYVKNEDDAREVMQESMIKVFENLHRFKGESALSSWITRIVINQAINFLRAKGKGFMQVSITEKLEMDVEDVLVEEPEKVMDAQTAMSLIRQMPEVYQVIFNLYAIDGLSHSQIAQAMNITEANSRQILMRGRKMLKQMIEKKVENVKYEPQAKH